MAGTGCTHDGPPAWPTLLSLLRLAAAIAGHTLGGGGGRLLADAGVALALLGLAAFIIALLEHLGRDDG